MLIFVTGLVTIFCVTKIRGSALAGAFAQHPGYRRKLGESRGYRPAADRLTVTITDDGCGMDAETVRKVTDPFYTTRTTRRVGMGLPLWKMAAEMTGGAMTVESAPGVGTTVTAVFGLSHIDRLPLGDLPQTMATLIGGSPEKDFRLEFDYDGARFAADTREYRAPS